MAIAGLDTSVVVRLLTGLPKRPAQAARLRLQRALHDGDTVVVTDLALAEAYYALQHHYGVPKSEAKRLLFRFAISGAVTIDPPGALKPLSDAGGAGLVDRLIHVRHRTLGGITLTFDERQSRLEGAEPIGTQGRPGRRS